jgi:hypothetical protein
MQLHHAAYAASCRHTPMTHAYTGASCSIAARPRHGLNLLTLTSATRAAGPRPNVIRPVDARATGLFLTITPKPDVAVLHSQEHRFFVGVGEQGLLLLQLAAVPREVAVNTAVEAPPNR